MAKLSGGRLAAAKAFKAARGHKGLSQKALSEASGVALGAIQQFEAGNTWPQAKSQSKLEPCVNMPAGELERIAAEYKGPSDQVDHDYESQAMAQRILELEADRARIDAELAKLRGE